MIPNIGPVENLLEDPRVDITLDELKVELNQIAKLRQNARVAFCKRLAIAYLLIVGHRPVQGVSDPKAKLFRAWCDKNLRSATGKAYVYNTLSNYLTFGFSVNPEAKIIDAARVNKRRDERMRKLGSGMARAITEGVRVIPITKLRQRLNTDVATEVNALMRQWEASSQEARQQFIYLVTGARLNIR